MTRPRLAVSVVVLATFGVLVLSGVLADVLGAVLTAHVWWPVVAVLLFMSFGIGRVVQREIHAQEVRERVLRAETRFRHPAGTKVAQRDRQAAMRVFRIETDAPGLAWSDPGADWARETCGTWHQTSMGTVRCPMTPGHDGPCL